MNKNLYLLILIIISTIIFTACSDKKTNKQIVTDAFQSLIELNSYQTASSLDINIEGENLPLASKSLIDMVNNATFNMKTTYDKEKQKSESIIHLKGTLDSISFDFSIPYLQDIANNKTYLDMDSINTNFGLMFPFPKELHGKLVELDYNQTSSDSESLIPNYTRLEEMIKSSLEELFLTKEDADFKRDKNVYSVTFTLEEFKRYYLDLMINYGENVDSKMREQLELELDTMFEDFQFNKFKVKMKIENDKIMEQSLFLDITYVEETIGAIQLELTFNTVFNSINKPVNFTIDLENKDIIPFEEVSKLLKLDEPIGIYN